MEMVKVCCARGSSSKPTEARRYKAHSPFNDELRGPGQRMAEDAVVVSTVIFILSFNIVTSGCLSQILIMIY